MNYADIGKNSNFDLRFVMFYLYLVELTLVLLPNLGEICQPHKLNIISSNSIQKNK